MGSQKTTNGLVQVPLMRWNNEWGGKGRENFTEKSCDERLLALSNMYFKDQFTVFNLCMIWLSVGIGRDYSLSSYIFDKRGFSVSSGLVFPLLCPVHTGFSLAPHGSNDPLIILYSDALIKLMCWFYVFNLPWSPHNPLSFPAILHSHSSEDPHAALITVPR